MTRRTIAVDGADWCADVAGELPGTLTILNATRGACVVAPPPDGPPGRLAVCHLSFGPYGQQQIATDAREYANLWGRYSVNGQPINFPGMNGAQPYIHSIPGAGYVAAHFRTGNVIPTGIFTAAHGSGLYPMDLKISRSPGDFSIDPNNIGATRLNEAPDDSPCMFFTGDPAALAFKAVLLPNTDYYLNIRRHDAGGPWNVMLTVNF